MMKVLFLSGSATAFGGVARWLELLVESLGRASVDCTVALAHGRHHDAMAYQKAHPSLPIVLLQNPTGAAASRWLAVDDVIRRYRPRVVVPVLLFDGLLGAALAKAESDARLVYPIHSLNAGALTDVRRFSEWIDAVVTVDRLNYKVVRNRGLIVPERVHLLPCGVPTPTTASEAFCGLPVRVTYCGRLEQPDKRVRDLRSFCEAARNLGIPVHLRLAGSGSEEPWLREHLLPMVSPTLSVEFHGPRSADWLYSNLYPSTDVLLVTSQTETGPLVAIEALAHGCAVITSDFEGRKREGLLEDGVNCLVYPIGDMSAAAEKLAVLLSDTGMRQRLQREGLTSASSRTVGRMTNQWIELLDRVTTLPGRLGVNRQALVRLGGPPGRLQRLGFPAQVADGIRRRMGIEFIHSSPSEEWPAQAVADRDLWDAYADA